MDDNIFISFIVIYFVLFYTFFKIFIVYLKRKKINWLIACYFCIFQTIAVLITTVSKSNKHIHSKC